MSTRTRKPSVKLVHGQAVTTSLKVAEAFGKQHKDVLRAIANLECSEEFNRRNFALIEYTDSANRKQPMYTITRDGFAFLASGFTGKEAAQWKEKYIAAFNELERRALEKATHKRLPSVKAETAKPPLALPSITRDLSHGINQRAWALSHATYEMYRQQMHNDIMVSGGHTRPEDWTPVENSQDVLELIFVSATLLEAQANSINIRGRQLAKMVGKDYVKATAKYRAPKK